jgi:hypothetical protein
MHSRTIVTAMVQENVKKWCGTLTANMTCGSSMPALSIEVNQFVPIHPKLECQVQYFLVRSLEKPSVPIGMKQIDKGMLQLCVEYTEEIASTHMDRFAKLCWKGEGNKFQEGMFELITKCGEDELIRLVRLLVITTFIMSHTLTIDNISGSSAEVSDMVSSDEFASSRLVNRQLKFAFHHIQWNLMNTTLSYLRNTFLHPVGYDNWLAAFVAVVGLCMALEDQQKTIHLVMETNIRIEELRRRSSDISANAKSGDERLRQNYEAKGNEACKAIDSAIGLIVNTFYQWSHRYLQDVADDKGPVIIISQFIQLISANRELYYPAIRYNPLISASWFSYRKKGYCHRANQLERLHVKARSKICISALGATASRREWRGRRGRERGLVLVLQTFRQYYRMWEQSTEERKKVNCSIERTSKLVCIKD